MNRYNVYKLNEINLALPAIDRAMRRSVDDEEQLDGLAAAWVRLADQRWELREAVSKACAPWFMVR